MHFDNHLDPSPVQPQSGKPTHSDWLKQISLGGTTNQKHCPDLGGDASSVWNFCARFTDDVITGGGGGGDQWWCRKMSAVVLGYHYVKMRYDHDEVYMLPPACAG